ncbi:stAR-related lipid transfer protein 9 [Protopterus annectens]|uniref:stAR-related lipid transfer protein 9 n=1 Tax=Protopterus annectens TaxID=7888 RepID=UPI001CFC3B8F|nr:stAR-related lipid transfer protein 9 [Protopterus annectens]
MANVEVAVRVRPLSKRESTEGANVIVTIEEKVIRIRNAKLDGRTEGTVDSREKISEFGFDYCYWSVNPDDSNYASQEVVFQDLGTSVLSGAARGYNVCLFAYGQTGSGKTYTMIGTPTSVGLTPRICEGLFARDSDSVEEPTSCRIEVSFLEIYNERVRDLLQQSDQKKPYTLRVREHPEKGPYVQGLSQHLVVDYKQVVELLEQGIANRITAATHMHDTSSRSHAIFTIQYTQAILENNLPSEIVSKINLVDLAGSERADPNYCKDRLTEGCNINKSLVTLGIVISTLAQNSQMFSSCQSINSIISEGDVSFASSHSSMPSFTSSGRRQPYIPYRDSVLTWLLKDSLGGNSKTIMIATISPVKSSYSETMSTLRYAAHAKNIVNKPRVNEDANVRLIRELREEIDRLKAMLMSYELQRNFSSPLSEDKDGNLADMVLQNELQIEQLTKDWTDKWTSDKCGVDINQGKAGVTIDSHLPHLIAMDDDILSTGVVLYYLREGKTKIGNNAAEQEPDIVLQGQWIEKEHCIIENDNGVVTLFPLEGRQCCVGRLEVTEPCRLSQGDIVTLGRTHKFRFNHPAEAAVLRKRRSNSEASLLGSGSLEWLDLEGTFSTSPTYSTSPVSQFSEDHQKQDEGAQTDATRVQNWQFTEFEKYHFKHHQHRDSKQELTELENFYRQQIQQQHHHVEELKQEILVAQLKAEHELEQDQAQLNEQIRETQEWLIREEKRLVSLKKESRELGIQTEFRFFCEAEAQISTEMDCGPTPLEKDWKRLVQHELLQAHSMKKAERSIRRKRVKFQLERIARKQKLLQAVRHLQKLEALFMFNEDNLKEILDQGITSKQAAVSSRVQRRHRSCVANSLKSRRHSVASELFSLLCPQPSTNYSGILKKKKVFTKVLPAVNVAECHDTRLTKTHFPLECIPRETDNFSKRQHFSVEKDAAAASKMNEKDVLSSYSLKDLGVYAISSAQPNTEIHLAKCTIHTHRGERSKDDLSEIDNKEWQTHASLRLESRKSEHLQNGRVNRIHEGNIRRSPSKKTSRIIASYDFPSDKTSMLNKSVICRKPPSRSLCEPNKMNMNISCKQSSDITRQSKNSLQSPVKTASSMVGTGRSSEEVIYQNSKRKQHISELLNVNPLNDATALLGHCQEETDDISDADSLYSVDSLSSAYVEALAEQLKQEDSEQHREKQPCDSESDDDDEMSQDSIAEEERVAVENREKCGRKLQILQYGSVKGWKSLPCGVLHQVNQKTLKSGRSFSLDSLADLEETESDDQMILESEQVCSGEIPVEIFWKLQRPVVQNSNRKESHKSDLCFKEATGGPESGNSFFLSRKSDSGKNDICSQFTRENASYQKDVKQKNDIGSDQRTPSLLVLTSIQNSCKPERTNDTNAIVYLKPSDKNSVCLQSPLHDIDIQHMGNGNGFVNEQSEKSVQFAPRLISRNSYAVVREDNEQSPMTDGNGTDSSMGHLFYQGSVTNLNHAENANANYFLHSLSCSSKTQTNAVLSFPADSEERTLSENGIIPSTEFVITYKLHPFEQNTNSILSSPANENTHMSNSSDRGSASCHADKPLEASRERYPKYSTANDQALQNTSLQLQVTDDIKHSTRKSPDLIFLNVQEDGSCGTGDGILEEQLRSPYDAIIFASSDTPVSVSDSDNLSLSLVNSIENSKIVLSEGKTIEVTSSYKNLKSNIPSEIQKAPYSAEASTCESKNIGDDSVKSKILISNRTFSDIKQKSSDMENSSKEVGQVSILDLGNSLCSSGNLPPALIIETSEIPLSKLLNESPVICCDHSTAKDNMGSHAPHTTSHNICDHPIETMKQESVNTDSVADNSEIFIDHKVESDVHLPDFGVDVIKEERLYPVTSCEPLPSETNNNKPQSYVSTPNIAASSQAGPDQTAFHHLNVAVSGDLSNQSCSVGFHQENSICAKAVQGNDSVPDTEVCKAADIPEELKAVICHDTQQNNLEDIEVSTVANNRRAMLTMMDKIQEKSDTFSVQDKFNKTEREWEHNGTMHRMKTYETALVCNILTSKKDHLACSSKVLNMTAGDNMNKATEFHSDLKESHDTSAVANTIASKDILPFISKSQNICNMGKTLQNLEEVTDQINTADPCTAAKQYFVLERKKPSNSTNMCNDLCNECDSDIPSHGRDLKNRFLEKSVSQQIDQLVTVLPEHDYSNKTNICSLIPSNNIHSEGPHIPICSELLYEESSTMESDGRTKTFTCSEQRTFVRQGEHMSLPGKEVPRETSGSTVSNHVTSEDSIQVSQECEKKYNTNHSTSDATGKPTAFPNNSRKDEKRIVLCEADRGQVIGSTESESQVPTVNSSKCNRTCIDKSGNSSCSIVAVEENLPLVSEQRYRQNYSVITEGLTNELQEMGVIHKSELFMCSKNNRCGLVNKTDQKCTCNATSDHQYSRENVQSTPSAHSLVDTDGHNEATELHTEADLAEGLGVRSSDCTCFNTSQNSISIFLQSTSDQLPPDKPHKCNNRISIKNEMAIADISHSEPDNETAQNEKVSQDGADGAKHSTPLENKEKEGFVEQKSGLIIDDCRPNALLNKRSVTENVEFNIPSEVCSTLTNASMTVAKTENNSAVTELPGHHIHCDPDLGKTQTAEAVNDDKQPVSISTVNTTLKNNDKHIDGKPHESVADINGSESTLQGKRANDNDHHKLYVNQNKEYMCTLKQHIDKYSDTCHFAQQLNKQPKEATNISKIWTEEAVTSDATFSMRLSAMDTEDKPFPLNNAKHNEKTLISKQHSLNSCTLDGTHLQGSLTKTSDLNSSSVGNALPTYAGQLHSEETCNTCIGTCEKVDLQLLKCDTHITNNLKGGFVRTAVVSGNDGNMKKVLSIVTDTFDSPFQVASFSGLAETREERSAENEKDCLDSMTLIQQTGSIRSTPLVNDCGFEPVFSEEGVKLMKHSEMCASDQEKQGLLALEDAQNQLIFSETRNGADNSHEQPEFTLKGVNLHSHSSNVRKCEPVTDSKQWYKVQNILSGVPQNSFGINIPLPLSVIESDFQPSDVHDATGIDYKFSILHERLSSPAFSEEPSIIETIRGIVNTENSSLSLPAIQPLVQSNPAAEHMNPKAKNWSSIHHERHSSLKKNGPFDVTAVTLSPSTEFSAVPEYMHSKHNDGCSRDEIQSLSLTHAMPVHKFKKIQSPSPTVINHQLAPSTECTSLHKEDSLNHPCMVSVEDCAVNPELDYLLTPLLTSTHIIETDVNTHGASVSMSMDSNESNNGNGRQTCTPHNGDDKTDSHLHCRMNNPFFTSLMLMDKCPLSEAEIRAAYENMSQRSGREQSTSILSSAETRVTKPEGSLSSKGFLAYMSDKAQPELSNIVKRRRKQKRSKPPAHSISDSSLSTSSYDVPPTVALLTMENKNTSGNSCRALDQVQHGAARIEVERREKIRPMQKCRLLPPSENKPSDIFAHVFKASVAQNCIPVATKSLQDLNLSVEPPSPTEEYDTHMNNSCCSIQESKFAFYFPPTNEQVSPVCNNSPSFFCERLKSNQSRENVNFPFAGNQPVSVKNHGRIERNVSKEAEFQTSRSEGVNLQGFEHRPSDLLNINRDTIQFGSSDINPYAHQWQQEESSRTGWKPFVFGSASDVSHQSQLFPDEHIVMRCSSVDNGLNAYALPFHTHLSAYANARTMSSTISSADDLQDWNDEPKHVCDCVYSSPGPATTEEFDMSNTVPSYNRCCGEVVNSSMQVDEIVLLYPSESESCSVKNQKDTSEQGTQTVFGGKHKRLNGHRRSCTHISSKSKQELGHSPSWRSVQNLSLHLSQLICDTTELLGSLSQQHAGDSGKPDYRWRGSSQKNSMGGKVDTCTQTANNVAVQTDCSQVSNTITVHKNASEPKAKEVNVVVRVVGSDVVEVSQDKTDITLVLQERKLSETKTPNTMVPSQGESHHSTLKHHMDIQNFSVRASTPLLNGCQQIAVNMQQSCSSFEPEVSLVTCSSEVVDRMESSTVASSSPLHASESFGALTEPWTLPKDKVADSRPDELCSAKAYSKNVFMIDRASSPILTLNSSVGINLPRSKSSHCLANKENSESHGHLVRHHKQRRLRAASWYGFSTQANKNCSSETDDGTSNVEESRKVMKRIVRKPVKDSEVQVMPDFNINHRQKSGYSTIHSSPIERECVYLNSVCRSASHDGHHEKNGKQFNSKAELSFILGTGMKLEEPKHQYTLTTNQNSFILGSSVIQGQKSNREQDEHFWKPSISSHSISSNSLKTSSPDSLLMVRHSVNEDNGSCMPASRNTMEQETSAMSSVTSMSAKASFSHYCDALHNSHYSGLRVTLTDSCISPSRPSAEEQSDYLLLSEVTRQPDDGDDLSVAASECKTEVLLKECPSTSETVTTSSCNLRDLPMHNKFSNWSGVMCGPPSRAASSCQTQREVRYTKDKTTEVNMKSSFQEDRVKEIEQLRKERAQVMAGIQLDLNPHQSTVELTEAKLNYGLGETDALLKVLKSGTVEELSSLPIKQQLYNRHMKTIEKLRREREERIQTLRRSRSLSPRRHPILSPQRDLDLPSRRREYLQQLRKDVVETTRLQDPKKSAIQSPSEIEQLLKEYQRAREEAKTEIAKARSKLRERTEQEKQRLQKQITSQVIQEEGKLKAIISTSTLCTGSSLSLSSGPTSGYNSSYTAIHDARGAVQREGQVKPDLQKTEGRGRTTNRACDVWSGQHSSSALGTSVSSVVASLHGSSVKSQERVTFPFQNSIGSQDSRTSTSVKPCPSVSAFYQDLAKHTLGCAAAEIHAACSNDLGNLFSGKAAAGWRFQGMDKGILIYYRPNSCATKHGFLGVGVINRPILNIWRMVKDHNNLHLYDKSIRSAQIHKKVDGSTQLAYFVSDMSSCYLKQPRDFCCISVEAQEESRYILAVQSVYDESMPRPGKDMVRGEVLPSAWILQPDKQNGKDVTRIIYLLQVDLGAPALPARLLGTVVKKQPLVILKLANILCG